MSVTRSSQEWAVCDSCGEIVRESVNPYVQQLYHSPGCPDQPARTRKMRQSAELPAELALLTDAGDRARDRRSAHRAMELMPAPRHIALGPGSHRMPGGRMARVATRAVRPVTAPPAARGRHAKVALGLLAAVTAIAGVALLVARPAAKGSPTADQQPASARAAVPSPAPTPSPRGSAPASSHQLGGMIPPMTPSPTSAPDPQTSQAAKVRVDFEDGADGWSPFWGNITGTPVTDPAFEGTASLLLTTSSDRFSAVGTTTDVTQLVPGDTVTYHVWSSGRAGSVQPFIYDDDHDAHFAGSSTQLPSSEGWFKLTWTIPATSSVIAIGLQVTDADTDGDLLRLAIGGLSWPAS